MWPEVSGGRQLDADISAAYPIVFVGVTQPALAPDAQRLDDWAARRTARLVRRALVEFLGAGPAGGQYQLSLGSIEHSDDRLQLILRLSQSAEGGATPVTGYDVSRRLLELASPSAPGYSEPWHSLVSSISVKNVYTVEINLRRSHVLPEAYLHVPLQVAADDADDGPFRVQARTDREIQFASKSFSAGGRLAEIVEVAYDGSQQAWNALRRGDIDVVDRLFPADALRLREDASAGSEIRVESYALPTVHLLVPNLKNPYLAERNFRRALLLAVDRETILREELMGGRPFPGFQVISGPFPARGGDADPLGYAYDDSTRPLPYSPFLAKVLTLAGAKTIADAAAKRGESVPAMKLVLGHPGHEMARIICQAIAAQWKLIGLEPELREFPAGVVDDARGECDLVYKEIALWEPVIDARRMLGATGVSPTPSPYVQQSLRWLDEVENWSEVRERLVDIHRAVYNDAAVLPLWQTVDFFACHKRLNNVGSNPVWLYQNVDQWRISVDAAVARAE
jgi:ABC-type transport system substrate-binding protein